MTSLLPRQTRSRAAAAAALKESDENNVPSVSLRNGSIAKAALENNVQSTKANANATKRSVSAVLGERQVSNQPTVVAVKKSHSAVVSRAVATKRSKTGSALVTVSSTTITEQSSVEGGVDLHSQIDPFGRPTKARAKTRKAELEKKASDEKEEEEQEDDKENVEPQIREEYKSDTAKLEKEQQANRQRTQFWEYEMDEENDPLMVFEYSNDIFEYMLNLEKTVMPAESYSKATKPIGEMTWQMRRVLLEWVIDVHSKFRLSPETLYLAANMIDRFLSIRPVSLVKVQLVGMAALMIAAKFEEIITPPLANYLYLADNGYSEEELLRAERYILSTLGFNLQYPSPMNFLRRISKADSYEITTRTLAKYLMELCLLDHRFIGVSPSLVSAAAMYQSRVMLRRKDQTAEWNSAFTYYSSYDEAAVKPIAQMILESISETCTKSNVVYKKYGNKKFMKASIFARSWVETHYPDGVVEERKEEVEDTRKGDEN